MAIWKNKTRHNIELIETEGEKIERKKLRLTKFLKREMIFTAISVLCVTILILGGSYAIFTNIEKASNYNVLVSGDLQIAYDDTSSGLGNIINLNGAYPESDTDGLKREPYKFKITNTGNQVVEYRIKMIDDLSMIEEDGCEEKLLSKNVIKYSINGGSPSLLSSSVDGSVEGGSLGAGESVIYTVHMWIDENATNEVLGKHYHGKIVVEGLQGEEKNLYRLVAKNAVLDNIQSEFVSSTTGINFGEVSSDTNGKGVYTFASTKDDKFPVHYYRGAVTDNNVKFANFCWKIVRTTETGGIKLIYNGTPDENGYCMNTTGEVTQIGTSAFNETYNAKEYVGYMVNNTSDSTIKGVIDNWYQTNMTDYTEKLDDAVFCNDRSSRVDESDGSTYFGAYDRAYTTYSPSLGCVNDADKFTVGETNGNGLLTYPVALLTSEEIMLAGGLGNTANSSYYLYTNQNWWALSPSYFGGSFASVLGVSSDGDLIYNDLYYLNGVRPALVLKPGTGITSGDGSQNSPFVVE